MSKPWPPKPRCPICGRPRVLGGHEACSRLLQQKHQEANAKRASHAYDLSRARANYQAGRVPGESK